MKVLAICALLMLSGCATSSATRTVNEDGSVSFTVTLTSFLMKFVNPSVDYSRKGNDADLLLNADNVSGDVDMIRAQTEFMREVYKIANPGAAVAAEIVPGD